MNTSPAFELSDLPVLLGLDLAEPADQSDIEAIEVILERRRAADSSMCPHRHEISHRAPLYLVPTPRPGPAPQPRQPNTTREHQR